MYIFLKEIAKYCRKYDKIYLVREKKNVFTMKSERIKKKFLKRRKTIENLTFIHGELFKYS